jgi:hypothetical protein
MQIARHHVAEPAANPIPHHGLADGAVHDETNLRRLIGVLPHR